MEPACTRFLFLLLSGPVSTLLFVQAPELQGLEREYSPQACPQHDLITSQRPHLQTPSHWVLGFDVIWGSSGGTQSQPRGVTLSPAGLRAATYELWRWINSGHNKETHFFSYHRRGRTKRLQQVYGLGSRNKGEAA